MPFSLHLVRRRKSAEVTMALGTDDALAPPVTQRNWENWVRMLQALDPYLEPKERRQVQLAMTAGKSVWLQGLNLSDADLARLGF